MSIFKTRLAQIQGIYKIDLSGATPMEWVLEYDSEQLRRLGITLSDIQQAVSRYYLKEFLGTYNVESSTGVKSGSGWQLMPEQKMRVLMHPVSG